MTGDKIKAAAFKLFPKGKLTQFDPYWYLLVDQYKINTPQRVSCFLAQVGVECNGFTAFEENLNYRVDRLPVVWPNRFAERAIGVVKNVSGKLVDGTGTRVKKYGTIYLQLNSTGDYIPNSKAKQIALKPVEIANTVYADREGNGSYASGDGWKYRGRGLKQLTFHNNYAAFGASIGERTKILANPDLLLGPEYGLKSAGWFWDANKLSPLADKTTPGKIIDEDFKTLTKKVTGGSTLIDRRWDIFNNAIILL